MLRPSGFFIKKLYLLPALLLFLFPACETTLPEVQEPAAPAAEEPLSPESPTRALPETEEPREAEEPQEEPEPPEPVTGGLVLSFFAFPGGLEIPVTARLFTPEDPEIPAAQETGSPLTFTLPPGNYSLAVEWETGFRRFEGISVAAGRLTERPVSLDAGTLTLEFLSSPGGGPAETAFSLCRGGTEEQVLVHGFSDRGTFLLAEGRYDLCIHGNFGNAWTRGIPVSAGETTARSLCLSHGLLAVTFMNPGGTEPAWAEYRLHPAENWERVLLWDSGGGFSRHLEEGTYDLYYAWDGGENWVRNIRLVPGSLVEQTIFLEK